MNKKLSLVLTALLAVALLLTACGSKAANLEGKWNAPDMGDLFGMAPGAETPQVVYEFKDGKLNMTMDGKPIADYMKEQMAASGVPEDMIANVGDSVPEITYKVDGNKITMSTTIAGKTEETTGEFKVEGDKLFLPDGKGGFNEFTRVK